MAQTLSPAAQRAFLTPIAFFRAINGSYQLDTIRQLTYQQQLTADEWLQCLELYQKHLGEEVQRNFTQANQHKNQVTANAESIAQLTKIAKSIPEITDIFLVNSYAMGALKPSSDIDLLVVTHPRLLWLARLKLTFALEKAGLRRKPGQVEDRFCLSFFVTSDALDMSRIALEEDVYLAYWTAQVQSLFQVSATAWTQQNRWLTPLFPNRTTPSLPTASSNSLPFLPALSLLNHLVRLPMKTRSKAKARTLGTESSIVISDQMLKFHNFDRRQLYKDRTAQELAKLEKLMKQ
ncbi:hypothetical protein KA517_02510 [Candidatus Gracilibacteria bacterium]|nr:hypothetical protein [Candidatus Gracilibacteria bacterium]